MLTFLGGGRGCAGALTRPSTRHLLPKNFEKTALRKRVGIFTVKMRGGHIYGNYCTQKCRYAFGNVFIAEFSSATSRVLAFLVSISFTFDIVTKNG